MLGREARLFLEAGQGEGGGVDQRKRKRGGEAGLDRH